jgi:hypothetical protein
MKYRKIILVVATVILFPSMSVAEQEGVTFDPSTGNYIVKYKAYYSNGVEINRTDGKGVLARMCAIPASS